MFTLPQDAKLVVGAVPQHCGALTCDYVCLKNYQYAWAIVTFDNTPNATAQDFHLYKATKVDGTDETADQTVNNWWYNDRVLITASDELTKGTAGATFTMTASQQGMLVIEIDPALYPGYDCFAVHADASNANNFMSVVYVLFPARYAQGTPPSAIVD